MACAPFSTDENCFRKTYKSSHETLGSTNCKTRIFAFRIFLMVWGNDAFDSVEMCNKFAFWFHYYDILKWSFCVRSLLHKFLFAYLLFSSYNSQHISFYKIWVSVPLTRFVYFDFRQCLLNFSRTSTFLYFLCRSQIYGREKCILQ